MSFFSKIFRPAKGKSHEQYSQDDFSRRTSAQADEGLRRAPVKSSMRRAAQRASIIGGGSGGFSVQAEADPINPYYAFHHNIRPQTVKGPRSVPIMSNDDDRRFDEDSGEMSGSSSNSNVADRTIHSEFIPTTASRDRYRHRSHGGRRSVKVVSPAYKHQSSRHRRKYFRDEYSGDSESEPDFESQLTLAVKQIKKYKSNLGKMMDDMNRLEAEKHALQQEYRDLKKQFRDSLTEMRQIKSENMTLKTQFSTLEAELAHFRAMYYQYSMPPPPPNRLFYPQPNPQPAYAFMTPPTTLRTPIVNTGSTGTTTLGGGGVYRPQNQPGGPHHSQHPPIGSGESLAFMSATTTASNAKFPGLDLHHDEVQDEIKVFRQADETSPSRPPTNCLSRTSFDLSSSKNNTDGQQSTGSSPKDNRKIAAETDKTPTDKTPVAGTAQATPVNSTQKMALFEQMLVSRISHTTSPGAPQTTFTPPKRTSSECDLRHFADRRILHVIEHP